MRFKNWSESNIGDLCNYIARGITPKYAESKGLVVLNQKCIRNYKVNLDSSRLHDASTKVVSAEKMLQKYDVLINSTGVGTAGRVAQWELSIDATCDSHITILRADSEKIDGLYFGYAIKAQQNIIEKLAEGSTGQTEMNRQRLMQEIVIRYPKNKNDQNKIAKILASIDDKIVLNNQINKNLEAQAQAIFKSWFVDFEPFQNDEFVESELGKIPKGWEVSCLNEFCVDMKNGATPSRKKPEYWSSEDIPWIKTGEINNSIIIECEEYISNMGNEKSSTKMLPENTVLIAMYGATAGKIGFLKFEATTNQACCAMITDTYNKAVYLYFWLLFYKNQIENMASGSAQQNLSKEIISSIKIISPNDEVISQLPFSNIFDNITSNLKQSKTLSDIRDSLLPKLMSGELKIPPED